MLHCPHQLDLARRRAPFAPATGDQVAQRTCRVRHPAAPAHQQHPLKLLDPRSLAEGPSSETGSRTTPASLDRIRTSSVIVFVIPPWIRITNSTWVVPGPELLATVIRCDWPYLETGGGRAVFVSEAEHDSAWQPEWRETHSHGWRRSGVPQK